MASSVGLAHVAVVSFLAARVAPTGSFWLSLTGGAALARESELRGLRAGYASSAAAMLQTVAIVGPLRFNAPLTQALSAPLLGAMHGRRRRPVSQVLACLVIRVAHYTALTLLAVFVLLGPKAYEGSYRTLFGWLSFLPHGLVGALILTAIVNLAAAIFFSIVQVLFYREALNGWSKRPNRESAVIPSPPPGSSRPSRTDPRVALLSAAVITGVLLVSHNWVVLAGGADREVLRIGLLLSALLAVTTLIATLVGGLGGDEAGSRSVRAALLVIVATWLRLAAGSAGLRETFRRMLVRLHRVPGAHEAGEILGELDSSALLSTSARALVEHVRAVPRQLVPIAGAVMTWAAQEAQSLPVHEPAEAAELRFRARDAVFAASSLLPAAALSTVLWA
jgi:hypothetical protein